MSRKPGKDIIIKAIKDSGGVMSTIAARLGCDWSTAKSWIGKSDETIQALKDETETLLDEAENVIRDAIKAGDKDAAKWYLSKKGKSRGYGDKIEIDLSGELEKFEGFNFLPEHEQAELDEPEIKSNKE